MKPVPMMPIPISRMARILDANALAAHRGFKRCIGEAQRLTPIGDRDRHGAARLYGLDEALQLDAVGVHIALQEEIQQRLASLGLLGAIAPQGRGPQIVVQQHAGRAEDLETLVIAIVALTAIVDMALPARG